MRADFAVSAERDLRAIHDYIFRDNPAAALRVVDRIEAAAIRIARYPPAR
jgi:plasmid stabilization system protein ParE